MGKNLLGAKELTKTQLRKIVLRLRFGTVEPGPGQPAFMTYGRIARFVRRSASSVRLICLSGLRGDHDLNIGDRRHRTKLSSEHQEFLKDPSTLREWAHLSLAERAVLFHRRFGEIKISPSALCRWYKRWGIALKRIRFRKSAAPS